MFVRREVAKLGVVVTVSSWSGESDPRGSARVCRPSRHARLKLSYVCCFNMSSCPKTIVVDSYFVNYE